MIHIGVSNEDTEKIIKHDDMWDYLTDDGSVEKDDYEVPEAWINAVAYVDDSPAAFICIAQCNFVTAEIHFGVHPEYRSISKKLGDALLKWAWDNTEYMKMIAMTHADVVRDFALSVGFRTEGINAASFLKNGKLTDQTYLGVIRCLQQ